MNNLNNEGKILERIEKGSSEPDDDSDGWMHKIPGYKIYKLCYDHWDDYLGDCNKFGGFLRRRSEDSKFWATVKFFDVFFRCVGETVFVNNPMCGLMMLVAIFIGHWKAGVGCVVGGLIATATDHCLGLHPLSMVDNGVSSFNGSLLGTVLPALFHLVSDTEAELWVAVCLGSVATVFVSAALLNSIGRLDAPFMTLPFNFIAIISFLNFQTDSYMMPPPAAVEEAVNTTMADNISDVESIQWVAVVEGCVLSMGQVWAVQNLATSLIMWVAVALYSPVLFILSVIGAVLGSFLPLIFLTPDTYSSVYIGLWGYSSILSIACVAWAQFEFSKKSFFAGMVNVVCTVFAQKSLARTLGKVGLPVFTLPFTLPTLLMVLCWRKQGQKWTGNKKAKTNVLQKMLATPFQTVTAEDEKVKEQAKKVSGIRDARWQSLAMHDEQQYIRK